MAGAPDIAARSVKEAQQRAVLRFLALHELLGPELARAGRAVEIGADLATPLALLRGLGWQVGFQGATAACEPEIARLYALDPAAPDDVPRADLLLLHPGAQLERVLDQAAAGARIVLVVPADGTLADGRAGQVDLLDRVGRRSDLSLVTSRTIYRDRWIFVLKHSPSSPQAARLASTRARIQHRLAQAIGAIPGASKPLARAEQALAHPHGFALARHTIWAARRKHALRDEAARLSHDPATISHFGVHAPANAGDLVLFEAVRAAIDPGTTRPWALRDVREPVSARIVADVNRGGGMVIGGGGLFLVDLDSSSLSGWQWPCPPALLDQIEVPIAVFAVGYNRFRGQDEFPQTFAESLHRLVEKSAFVGIRNRGSIRALREYLPGFLREKLTYQPCPTTVMHYLEMPGARDALPPRLDERPHLVINAAFDRFAMRMAGHERETLSGIARIARRAQDAGWRITMAGHLFDDEAILPFLYQAGVQCEIRHFTGVPTADILRFYRSVDLVAGMRGHAQMVPFGVGTPIISLVAHDKMGWFLDDIGHPEWGVDFREPDFADRLQSAFDRAAGDIPAMRRAVDDARARLWAITNDNLRIVRAALQFREAPAETSQRVTGHG